MFIHNPHPHITIKPQGKRTGSLGYFGVELECEPVNSGTITNRDKMLESLGSEETAKLWAVTDGSLDYAGVEFNTQPATLPALFRIMKPVYSAMSRYDYTSEYNYDHECGLHVHISRSNFGVTESAQEIGAYRMSRLIERHTMFFESFCGRSLNGWCSSDYMENFEMSFLENSKKPVRIVAHSVQEWTDDCHGSHTYGNHEWTERKYVALNMQHKDTFELRIGAGMPTLLNFETYMIQVQAVVNLAKRRNLKTEWFETCSLEDFIYEFNVEYHKVLDLLY